MKQPSRLLTNEELRLIRSITSKSREEFCLHDKAQSDLYDSYFIEAFRQNASKELITHQNEKWVDTIMNFRDGATTVIGTLCEYIAHLAYLRRGHRVTPLYGKEFQMTDRDFLIDDRCYASIKKYTGDDYMRLGDDYFERNSPELTYITFVQLETLSCCSFPVGPLRTFFHQRRRADRDNGYIYERMSAMPLYETL